MRVPQNRNCNFQSRFTLFGEEPGWSAWWLGDPWPDRDAGVVLAQPGRFEHKQRLIDYTIIEILAGDVGERALARAGAHWAAGGALYLPAIPAESCRALRAGRLGTFALFGDADRPGLLTGAEPATESALAALTDPARPSPPPAREAVSDEERAILRAYRVLEPAARYGVRALLGADEKKNQ